VEWTEGDDEAGLEGDIPDESAAYLDFLNKEVSNGSMCFSALG
jgi:hypothetical protein